MFSWQSTCLLSGCVHLSAHCVYTPFCLSWGSILVSWGGVYILVLSLLCVPVYNIHVSSLLFSLCMQLTSVSCLLCACIPFLSVELLTHVYACLLCLFHPPFHSVMCVHTLRVVKLPVSPHHVIRPHGVWEGGGAEAHTSLESYSSASAPSQCATLGIKVQILKYTQFINFLIPTSGNRDYRSPHFTDEETDAQGGQVMWP